MNFATTPTEHKFSSTGSKLWRHREAMESYRDGTGRTVISTHVSPEGFCNLDCPYCSVHNRDTHNRIKLPVIKQYIADLMTRGLKAVILTGGGEPTIYPHFNELVQWLHNDCGLKVGLITNGTQARLVKPATWACFAWVRVSINVFPDWEAKIRIANEHLSPDCTVGCSIVYSPGHRLDVLQKVPAIADALKAVYVRVVPNCLLEQDKLIAQHEALDADLKFINDPRFYQQHRLHKAPGCGTCHQSYFRPYLSEVVSIESGEPGTVFPCDAVVLHGAAAQFGKLYQLCPASKVLDYMDRKIAAGFSPKQHCPACMFTAAVDMLHEWKETGEGHFVNEPVAHENFV